MAAARADNGMDPFTVLGISVRAVRGKEDLYKLKKRCKALIDGYLVKRQGSNARRVKWAFDQIKLKVCKEAQELAAAAAAATAGPAEVMGPCPSPPPEAETPEDRLEAIRNKAAARRERMAAGGDDPEAEKRRETIREKLAVKRALKQVPVLKEEEARQKVVSFLASPPAGALSPERVKLSCVTTGTRLSLPGRGKECQHLQCFDVEQYLLKKYTHCPICGIALAAPEIFVDSYVTKILVAVDDKVKEVAFSPDGAYAPFKERPPQPPSAAKSAPPRKAAAAAARPEKRPREETPQAPEAVAPPESEKPREEAPKAAPVAEAKPPKEEKKEKEEKRAQKPPKAAPKAPKAPLTPEQLREEAQREEKRKRAKLYHALRADEVVDPAEESNYVVVELPTANMGLVLRPNPSLIGGAFVEALETDGAAAKHGGLKAGDQLVGIGEKLVVGQDIDACIDLIVPDSRGLARLAVFRGSASSLYGKGMPSEWLKGFMARVACGEVDLTLPVPEPEPEVEEAPEPAQEPALEKKKKKNARLSMSSEESGSSDAEADDFSLQLSEDSDGEASPRRAQAALPERLVARITGAGLAADLDACVEALRQPPVDGTVEQLESRLVSKAVIKASIASNLESWGLLDDQEQSSWKAAASKRLVRAVGERAERLEAMRLVQAQEQQRSSLAEVAAIAASRQGGGLEDAMEDERLLKLEPDKSIKFDRNRTAQLTLRSHSSSHVAFRVRTSAPKFIFVQPCAGTLTPGQHMNLQVCSSERNLGALGTLKFLVQAVPAPDADILPKEKWALLDNSSIQEWSLVGRL